MSEGIFGKNADLAQRLKDRIAFHANEHRHTYEIGKGVMDALVLDLLADFRDAGGVILPVKPNGTVWLIRRRRVVSATVMFVGAGADGLTSFSVLRGRLLEPFPKRKQFRSRNRNGSKPWRPRTVHVNGAVVPGR